MGVELSTFPSLPSSIQTMTLDGAQFRLRLTWRHRNQGWYLDLWTLAGTPLLLGRRLSAGWSPNLALVLEDGPDGFLYVRGLDGYAREDLGTSLRLMYYPASEIAALAPAADDSLSVALL